MSEHLQESVQQFSNHQIIEQYYLEKNQFTEDALAVMKQELDRRCVSQDEIDAVLAVKASSEGEDPSYMVRHFDKTEYESLNGAFSQNDALIVRSMLAENSIPLIMGMSAPAVTLGTDAPASNSVSLLVHRDYMENALKLIAEHFDLSGELYSLKYNDTLSRLKAFNFYEVSQAVLASHEITAVELSSAEKNILTAFGRRLLNEADTIEFEQERVIFYYDAVEPLIEQLEQSGMPHLSHTDLLAALEILQIYCSDPGFSDEARGIADVLLHFFAGHASV